MKTVLVLQVLAGCFISVLAGFWEGKVGALTAGMVALAVFVPNALFAFFLFFFRKSKASGFVFLAGEMLKNLITAGLLVLLVGLYPVHWPSFLISLIVVLQVAFLALWKR